MDKNELIDLKKYNSGYNSTNYLLASAWEIGTDKEKQKIEESFPELFKDSTIKWRPYEEMGQVANGYYWHCEELLVNRDNRWRFADSERGTQELHEISTIGRQFYGPIEFQKYEPKTKTNDEQQPQPFRPDPEPEPQGQSTASD